MSKLPEPDKSNFYLVNHISLLIYSYKKITGLDLIPLNASKNDVALTLYHAPFVVLSHNTESDPIFNYANKAAQALFEMSWSEFVTLPSRLSAEPMEQEQRQRLLTAVNDKGFIDDYSGIRISKSGKRFLISQATIWNIHCREGIYRGQAAWFTISP